MSRGNSLISRNVITLQEGLGLLARLDQETYTACESPFNRGGIGSHLRHCLEFYEAFLGSYKSGKVDYDSRPRNLTVERDLGVGLARGRELLTRLESCRDSRQGDLWVKHDGSEWSTSSIGRELIFLLSHTVHHFSIIAIALKLRGVEPGADFGVAPSTLANERGAA